GGHARLAVECDGDEFHGIDQYEHDTRRQRMLERCGWVFYRIRAAEFYANKESALKNLWLMLEERNIFPQPESSGATGKETTINHKRVEIGDTVVYTKEDESDSERQALITQERSDPELGAINIKTPIAQALLGASIGEVVLAKLPMGNVRILIKEIKKNV